MTVTLLATFAKEGRPQDLHVQILEVCEGIVAVTVATSMWTPD